MDELTPEYQLHQNKLAQEKMSELLKKAIPSYFGEYKPSVVDYLWSQDKLLAEEDLQQMAEYNWRRNVINVKPVFAPYGRLVNALQTGAILPDPQYTGARLACIMHAEGKMVIDTGRFHLLTIQNLVSDAMVDAYEACPNLAYLYEYIQTSIISTLPNHTRPMRDSELAIFMRAECGQYASSGHLGIPSYPFSKFLAADLIYPTGYWHFRVQYKIDRGRKLVYAMLSFNSISDTLEVLKKKLNPGCQYTQKLVYGFGRCICHKINVNTPNSDGTTKLAFVVYCLGGHMNRISTADKGIHMLYHLNFLFLQFFETYGASLNPNIGGSASVQSEFCEILQKVANTVLYEYIRSHETRYIIRGMIPTLSCFTKTRPVRTLVVNSKLETAEPGSHTAADIVAVETTGNSDDSIPIFNLQSEVKGKCVCKNAIESDESDTEDAPIKLPISDTKRAFEKNARKVLDELRDLALSYDE